MPVVVQRQVLVGGSRQCSRAVLGQGCLVPVVMQDLYLGSRCAEYCGRPTVAVLEPDGRFSRGDFTRCSSWTRFTCPSLCLAPMARQCRKLWRFIPQVLFSVEFVGMLVLACPLLFRRQVPMVQTVQKPSRIRRLPMQSPQVQSSGKVVGMPGC